MASRSPGPLSRWRRDALRRMASSRVATGAFVAGIPAEEMSRPRTLDRWSAKDMVAHLLTCDEETVRRFQLIARGRADKIFWFRGMADADRFNARMVKRERRTSLAALLRRRRRVGADLIARFQRLPLGALKDPTHEWTVVQWLTMPGWAHEAEHLHEMKAWWRGRQRELRADAEAARRRRA
jgi:hypothetical protein